MTPIAEGRTASPQDDRLQLQGEIELIRLVDLCAELLDLNIEYDPSALRAKLTLRLGDGISNDELWTLTNRLLASRNLTSIRMPGEQTLSIVRTSEATALSEVLWAPPEQRPAGFQSRAVQLQHLSASEATEQITPLLSKSGSSVQSLGENGPIIISDLTPRLETALQYLESIDRSEHEPITRVIAVRNLKATQLAATVTATMTARGSMMRGDLQGKLTATPDDRSIVLVCPIHEEPAWLELIERFDQQEAVLIETYTVPSFALDSIVELLEQTVDRDAPGGSGNRWRLVRDELTFTLTVTATTSEHAQIQSVLDRLNSVPEEERRPIRTFVIRNRSVVDVMDVLDQLVLAGIADDGNGTTGRRTARDIQTTPLQGTATGSLADSTSQVGVPGGEIEIQPSGQRVSGNDRVTLTADEGTNRIIAIGDATVLDQIETLIEQIDIRQPQVMVEVTVASLTEGDTFDLGVELNKIEMSGGTLIDLASLFGLGSDVDTTTVPAGGAGFNGVILNPGDFSVIIRALETINSGRAVNLPKLLVNNNEEAVLNSVQQEPFLSTNASDTVATTSFGGTQDAGTTVTVTPQISEADHLILDYSVAVSTFTGESSDPSLPPPRQQNTLQSAVTIPDGYTLVVGGLTVENAGEAISQVPILGGIPLLGELFKNRSKSKSRTRFVIFIRCNIMRHDNFEDLLYASEPERLEMGIESGWPEVTPRIIK
ncbi:MAG: secretin N-terminal domain-containing protein [Planctomycetota bacterium]